MRTATVLLKHSINCAPSWLAILITIAFALFALAPFTYAQCPQICDGAGNTAIGDSALDMNTGFSNTATGSFALSNGNTGSENTANGAGALTFNTSGGSNTASGAVALDSNTTGGKNTATGAGALQFNTTGSENTANGFGALASNLIGNNNIAEGFAALATNTTGSSNIAIGSSAGLNLTTGSNNIDIGNAGMAGESKTIRIGAKQTHRNTYIAAINGVTVPTGVAVIVDANGHLGTITSSARYKDAIKPMDKASEAILALKPVTFHYKHDLDPTGIPQFGLVAEDVEKVNPDLVARDEHGKPYTVRYEAVNAMLLNEFLKEHKTVQEQAAAITQQRKDFQAAIAQQQKEIEALTATVKQQSARIQKVSAQLELGRPALQSVVNNH